MGAVARPRRRRARRRLDRGGDGDELGDEGSLGLDRSGDERRHRGGDERGHRGGNERGLGLDCGGDERYG